MSVRHIPAVYAEFSTLQLQQISRKLSPVAKALWFHHPQSELLPLQYLTLSRINIISYMWLISSMYYPPEGEAHSKGSQQRACVFHSFLNPGSLLHLKTLRLCFYLIYHKCVSLLQLLFLGQSHREHAEWNIQMNLGKSLSYTSWRMGHPVNPHS